MSSLPRREGRTLYPALPRSIVSGLCGAATLALAILLFLDLRRGHPNTFSVFYYAAKALESGGDIYRSHPPGSDRPEYVYPPLFALLVAPLVHFTAATATRIWTVVDACLTVLALVMGARETARRFQIPPIGSVLVTIAAGGLLLGIGELKTELGTSQTDTLVLVSFVLALSSLDRWPGLCGLALGFSANIKYQTLIALPYLLITRRWRAAASTALSATGFALLPGLVTGFARNREFLRQAVGGLVHFASIHTEGAASTVPLTWIRSISLTSAMARGLEYWGVNPSRAFLLAPVVACGLGGIAALLYRRHRIPMAPRVSEIASGGAALESVVAVEWTGLMVAWLVFGPEVSRRHMYVLLLMHMLAVGQLFKVRGSQRLLLVAGMVIGQVGLRIPTDAGTAGTCFNWVGGASWTLLIYYATLLSACFSSLRSRQGNMPSNLRISRSGVSWNYGTVNDHAQLDLSESV
jgi:alpha-1,2-mannosyltransferase